MLAPVTCGSLVEKYGSLFVVFLDRNASDFHRDDAKRKDGFIGRSHPTPQRVFEKHVGSTEHLRVWRVGEAARS